MDLLCVDLVTLQRREYADLGPEGFKAGEAG